ncbi:hypothetical protein BGZ73_008073 [Actinomortierella ambigua]|nr:hypothetical protein BGZ73_008073 [Actinomortierella ambigua]
MSAATRPFFLLLTLFAFTQVVTRLWPQHHLRSSTSAGFLAKRALGDDDHVDPIHCTDIWRHPDRCQFVKDHCADYPAGLINYLQFYFCDLPDAPVAALILLALWLMSLFGFVGIAASDFFCPNLNTIAKKLHLSESMTGVTFLAFGNGSPDVFSTFSAMGAGSGSLAIGELVGAASFITSVVVGCISIISPFRVSKSPYLRDVSFFAGAVSFTLYAVVDGEITFLESVLLIFYYLSYVMVVVVGNWWHQKKKMERHREQLARSHYEDETESTEDANGADEEQTLLAPPTRPKPRHIITEPAYLHPPPGPYDPYEDLEDEDFDGEGGTESISMRASGVPMRRRPSLMSAVEVSKDHDLCLFHDVVRSLTLSGSRGRVASYDPSYYGVKSPHPHSKRHSYNSRSSSRPRSINGPPSAGLRSAGPDSGPTSIPTTRHSDEINPFDAHILNRSLILPDYHDPSNQHLGHLHRSPSPMYAGPRHEPPKTLKEKLDDFFVLFVKPTYFPTLLDWNKKSTFVKFLAVNSIPMVLLLTLTLPVVELAEDDDDDSCDEDATSHHNDAISEIFSTHKEHVHLTYEGWNRLETTVQMLLAPVFIATVISTAAENGYLSILLAFGLGIILSSAVYFFSTEEEPPRFYGALSFAGFLVAITWIFLVANEVVGILQAFGMIFRVSDAILGLTIFAMGNSLGDLVANVTVARMGFPRMAFSACFGGPLLNMLLGVGISGTYMTAKTGQPIPIEVSPTLFVSLVGVLVTLVAAIVIVPYNNYIMGRRWGWFLLCVYFLCTVINVLVEVKTTSRRV